MFDLMIIGQITLDRNIDYDGREEKRPGGAVTFSGYAAAAIGHSVAVVPKGDPARLDPAKVFAGSKVDRIFPVSCNSCTVMQNTYFTPDRERRLCLNTESIAPYTPADLPDEPARIYHLAGLVAGDLSALHRGNTLIGGGPGHGSVAGICRLNRYPSLGSPSGNHGNLLLVKGH